MSEPEQSTSVADSVVGWLVAGHREADIRKVVAQKFPGQSADTIIDAAKSHFRAAGSIDTDLAIGWASEAYKDLYRRMVEIGDFSSAGKILKLMLELHRDKPAIDAGESIDELIQ